MARRTRNIALQVLFALITLGLQACSGGGIPSQDVAGRASDGLLDRPDLQSVVDLQEARDGEGLIGRLEHPDPVVRARAAFALGSVQETAALPALEGLMEDADASVRADAAFALGQSADSTSSEALLAAWGRELDPEAWGTILEAIGKTGGYEALGRLAGAEVPVDRRSGLALALARFGLRGFHSHAAVDRLTGWLQDRDPALRHAAAYYFGRIRETGSWAWAADRLRSAVDAAGPRETSVMYLVQGLSRLEGEGDTERIRSVLRRSSDWRVRTNAAQSLAAHTGSPAARADLLAALDDRSEHVAISAAASLAGSESLTAEDRAAVRSWIDAGRADLRVDAALLPALARAGETDYVLKWVRTRAGDDERARASGFEALASAPGDAAFSALVMAAEAEEPTVAVGAIRALGARWRRARNQDEDPRPYFDLFAKSVQRGDVALAYEAAPLLADRAFADLGAREVLEKAYRGMSSPRDIEPMVQIVNALGRIGDRSSLPLIMDAAEAPDEVLRDAAAAAAARISGGRVERTRGGGPEARTTREIDWGYLAAAGPAPRIRLETDKGEIVLRLDTEEAPLTVQTILQLAEEGRYDGVPFHRVVPNFVIQGGDFASQDGFGGPGFVIRSEFTRIPYLRGVAGMASAGKDTEGSQYFITHSMQPHLDGRYTAFGYVEAGMDVVDAIYPYDLVVHASVVGGSSENR